MPIGFEVIPYDSENAPHRPRTTPAGQGNPLGRIGKSVYSTVQKAPYLALERAFSRVHRDYQRFLSNLDKLRRFATDWTGLTSHASPLQPEPNPSSPGTPLPESTTQSNPHKNRKTKPTNQSQILEFPQAPYSQSGLAEPKSQPRQPNGQAAFSRCSDRRWPPTGHSPSCHTHARKAPNARYH